ncbi:TetR/AcrR family transcriptional regulator [Microlunatus soli]|uniref:DNA-binding transcriptional regulator, AcrR family n=1 Tax=Microlunatus soli TaxID=630515 RepID=A0A1H1MMB5_9ACTN|nr:TetR/AcrR family transcriptional regulator [Microlunatus soli]SDR87856.1 DNA-binding transcriptional regulator, AcrR family [Microlunatus soli]
MSESVQAAGRDEVRSRIVDVASQLLRDQGPEAVTTRRVAEAAGAQPPTIYRLFGDKDGLMQAVAEQVMADHVAAKAEVVRAASATAVDPIEDLRIGWDTQIDFGLANPAIFRLLNDPNHALDSPAARTGREILRARVHRVATHGRLRVREDHAVDLIHAAGIGTVQVLLAMPPEQRDQDLAASMFAAVLGQVLTPAPEDAVAVSDDAAAAAAAVTLRAVVPALSAFSDGERLLLGEWLGRISGDGAR